MLLCGCADVEVGHESAPIVNGGAEAGYPAVFSIAYSGEAGCTGTCVSPHVGITAAHCATADDQPEDLSAGFGDNWDSPQTSIGVVAIERAAGTADFAVLAFDQACPASVPYNSEPLDALIGEPVVLVGYGVTSEDGTDAGPKRSGTATLASVDAAEVNGMDPGELATSNAPSGSCYGDSGGPTFITIDGVETVIGATSRGSLDDSGNDYPCGEGLSLSARTDANAELIAGFIATYDGGGSGGDGGGGDGDGDGSGGGDGGGDGDTGSAGGDALSGGCSISGSSAGGPLYALLLLALLALATRERAPR